MDIFSDSLTPEEATSQFSLSEVDDESFALEQLGGTYPEAIPAVNPDTILNSMNEDRSKWPIETGYDDNEANEPESVANETPENNPPESDENIAADDTVTTPEEPTDLPEADDAEAWQEAEVIDEQTTEEPAIIEDADVEEVTLEATKGTLEDVEDILEEAEIVTEEPLVDTQSVDAISSIDDIFNMPQDGSNKDNTTDNPTAADYTDMDTSNIEEADAAPVAPQTVQIDDSLRSLLMEDLEEDATTKPVPTMATEPPQVAKEEEEKESNSIMDISEEPAATVDTAKPQAMEANTELEELSWDSETNEVKTTQKANKKANTADKKRTLDSKETAMTEEEEKNTTKKFALILVIVAVVMIFIIGGIIGYLYLSNKSNIQSNTQADTTAVAQAHKPAPKASSDTATHKSHVDSVKVDSNTTADSNKALATDANNKPMAPTVDEKPQTPVPPKPPVATEQTSRPRATTRTKPATTKTSSNTQVAQRSTKQATKTVTQSPKEPTTAIYSIQMYSSPSKSDAEERLVLLANKNITGYITTQQIKGQTWYRVRFGRYSSYEEASAEVMRLNIKDAWIERVR